MEPDSQDLDPYLAGARGGTSAVCSGLDEAGFKAHAEKAKEGCPVSKALAGPKITLTATLRK